MKVLFPGPVASGTSRIACQGCGALLEYVPADVRTYTTNGLVTGPVEHRFVQCPECECDTDISTVDVNEA